MKYSKTVCVSEFKYFQARFHPRLIQINLNHPYGPTFKLFIVLLRYKSNQEQYKDNSFVCNVGYTFEYEPNLKKLFVFVIQY